MILLCRTISFVKWYFKGNKYGNFASSDSGMLWIHQPHLISWSSSKNSLNCRTKGRECDWRLVILSGNASCWIVCNYFSLALESSDGVRCPMLWVTFRAIVINQSTYIVTASSFCRLLYLLMSMICTNCVGNVWVQWARTCSVMWSSTVVPVVTG